MSSLYDILGNKPQTNKIQNNVPLSKVLNQSTVQQFLQFAQTFSGNPEQVGRNLLASGKLSPQLFEQFSEIARQFQSMIPQTWFRR